MLRRTVFAFAICVSLSLHAQTVAERYLFSAVNQERVSAGLAPVVWSPTLATAARAHAATMARYGTISHQFRGEADLVVRASGSGTRFSRVTENVGMSPSALQMHDAWMHSSGHRANIMDAQVTSLGIAVIIRNGYLWAVEDFAREVEGLSIEQQEARVAALIQQTVSVDVSSSAAARQTCSTSSGFKGDQRPSFVMRFSASDLSRLPEQLNARLKTGQYSQASVGACSSSKKSDFAGYNVAVLLFR